jgi:hypothetical protein
MASVFCLWRWDVFRNILIILVLATLMACSLSILVMSSAMSTAVPTIAENAPAVVREFRHTDTLDELQEFAALERPSRPVWPFILFLVITLLLFGMVVGAPFLKQTNSLVRQFKRRGHGRATHRPTPPSNPIILPPGYGQPQLPPAAQREESEW